MTAHDDDLVPDDLVPDDLADLFAAERMRPELERPAEATRAQLWSRIVASTGPFSGGGGPGDSAGDGGASAPRGDGPVPVTSGPPAAAAAAGGVAVGQAWLGTTAAKIALSAAIFAAGGATGVAVDRSVTEPRVVTVTVEAPREPERAAASAPLPPPMSAPSPSVSAAPVDGPRLTATPGSAAPSPSAVTPSGPARDADLDAERSLLERARTALGRGDAGGAVDALSQHAARFPRGRLGEEREALWIQALIASGRTDEARTRFERFRARHPSSLLVQAMEAALQR